MLSRSLLVLCLLFTACYHHHEMAKPIEIPDDSINFVPPDWWTLFHDSQLKDFIALTLERNPTIHIARENVFLAASKAQQVRSRLFPNVLWGADVSRQKLSETGIVPFNRNRGVPPTAMNTPFPAPGGENGIPVYFTQYETQLFLTYDFDIWGKNRNAFKAAIGEVKAKIADEAFIALEMGISVARVYFQLQTNYQRHKLAKKFVENKSRYLALVKERVQSNLNELVSVKEAEVDLVGAKQGLLNLEKEIELNEILLKTYLAGDFTEQIAIHEIGNIEIPVLQEIPLHLISNRPDIISQLWLIESAGKEIEVAKAGFYPDINLAALFGFQTIHLNKLFEWKSVYYNIDPAISLPIFDGGLLRANLLKSEVDYNLAIYEYNNRVLNGVREVLEGLALVRNTTLQLEEFRRRASIQREIVYLTSLKVENHLSSGLDYLKTEAQLLIDQDVELIAQGNMIQSVLTLIKALGGGYDPCA